MIIGELLRIKSIWWFKLGTVARRNTCPMWFTTVEGQGFIFSFLSASAKQLGNQTYHFTLSRCSRLLPLTTEPMQLRAGAWMGGEGSNLCISLSASGREEK